MWCVDGWDWFGLCVLQDCLWNMDMNICFVWLDDLFVILVFWNLIICEMMIIFFSEECSFEILGVMIVICCVVGCEMLVVEVEDGIFGIVIYDQYCGGNGYCYVMEYIVLLVFVVCGKGMGWVLMVVICVYVKVVGVYIMVVVVVLENLDGIVFYEVIGFQCVGLML